MFEAGALQPYIYVERIAVVQGREELESVSAILQRKARSRSYAAIGEDRQKPEFCGKE